MEHENSEKESLDKNCQGEMNSTMSFGLHYH